MCVVLVCHPSKHVMLAWSLVMIHWGESWKTMSVLSTAENKWFEQYTCVCVCVSFSCFLHHGLYGNLFHLSNRKLMLLATIALELPKLGRKLLICKTIRGSEMWNLFSEASWNHKSQVLEGDKRDFSKSRFIRT